MIERRETTREAKKPKKVPQRWQRAQLRRSSCKLKAESRERQKIYCAEQLRESLGSLGVQVKSQRAEGCRKPKPDPKKLELKSQS